MSQNVLVINSGSSSIKLSLFDNFLARQFDAHVTLPDSSSKELKLKIKSSHENRETILKHNGNGLIASLPIVFEHLKISQLYCVGHRFVHGGDRFKETVRIDKNILAELEKLSDLAPLHNDLCLEGIKQCIDFYGESVPEFAVFDTAFHSTLPEMASQYAIPHQLAKKYAIKRYGFHGISHDFLRQTFENYSGKKNTKLITIHLGNGCSMAAIQGGVSVDTSMGFTPAEGLVMSTRSGDIDHALIEFLCLHEKMTPSEVMAILNNQSGLLGISQFSSSMEKLIDEYDRNELIRLAVDIFCYRIQKYIGAYMMVLGGVEGIVFSGGIGENSPHIRHRVIQGLEWIGVGLDELVNKKSLGLPIGSVAKISSDASKIGVYAIATDENLYIAKEVLKKL